MAQLPIDLTLRLPDPGWLVADPAELGLPGAAFAATRPEPGAVFAPLLTVSGGLRDATEDVAVVAEESLAVFAEQVADAEVVDRVMSGTPTAPGVSQVLAGRAPLQGRQREVRQAQVVATAPTREGDRRAVVVFTLTCLAEQLGTLGPQLQTFVASARPEGA